MPRGTRTTSRTTNLTADRIQIHLQGIPSQARSAQRPSNCLTLTFKVELQDTTHPQLRLGFVHRFAPRIKTGWGCDYPGRVGTLFHVTQRMSGRFGADS